MDWEEVDRQAGEFWNKAWIPVVALILLSCFCSGCLMGVLHLIGVF